jgi:hypothetical protein
VISFARGTSELAIRYSKEAAKSAIDLVCDVEALAAASADLRIAAEDSRLYI